MNAMTQEETDMKEIAARCGFIRELVKGTKYGTKADADAMIFHAGRIQDIAIRISETVKETA